MFGVKSGNLLCNLCCACVVVRGEHCIVYKAVLFDNFFKGRYYKVLTEERVMGKAKKARANRVKFAVTKRLLSPKDCRLKDNMKHDEERKKKV